MDIVWFVVIGGAAGWLAGKFMKGGGFGLFGNVVVGVVGAVIGGFLFGLLGLRTDGSLVGALVTSFVGAVVLLFAVGFRRGG
jgi:uncharacterized membrane protein YeaQ/YmgE (transglycosylase-associated protein family)